jgi:pyroglutamyl-peptidase
MKILVSGFEPYGEMSVNPTQTLVREARGFNLEGIEIHSVVLPVNYDECVEKITEEINHVSPDVVVSCGIYPGRAAITPERVGLNVKDTMAEDLLADKRGKKPVDEPINAEGPDALFSGLPYRRINENLLAAGIPSYVSNTAGTYICNNTMYGILDHIRRNQLPTIAGFVHFPLSTEMAIENPTQPSLPMGIMVEALQIILRTVAEELEGKSTEAAITRSSDN